MKKLQVYARRRKPDGHLEHTTKIIQGQGLEPGHSTTESWISVDSSNHESSLAVDNSDLPFDHAQNILLETMLPIQVKTFIQDNFFLLLTILRVSNSSQEAQIFFYGNKKRKTSSGQWRMQKDQPWSFLFFTLFRVAFIKVSLFTIRICINLLHLGFFYKWTFFWQRSCCNSFRNFKQMLNNLTLVNIQISLWMLQFYMKLLIFFLYGLIYGHVWVGTRKRFLQNNGVVLWRFTSENYILHLSVLIIQCILVMVSFDHFESFLKVTIIRIKDAIS